MNNLILIYDLKFNLLQTLGPLPIYLLIFIVIYFVMIRPQVKQQKNHSKMLSDLNKGDKIMTQGGIIGAINNFKGKDNEIVVIDVNNTKIDISRNHIKSLYTKK